MEKNACVCVHIYIYIYITDSLHCTVDWRGIMNQLHVSKNVKEKPIHLKHVIKMQSVLI